MNRNKAKAAWVLGVLAAAVAVPAFGQVDFVETFLAREAAVGNDSGTQLRSFHYDPATDTTITVAGLVGGGYRTVTGTTGGSPVTTLNASLTQWVTFLQSNNPPLSSPSGGSSPVAFSLIANPVAINLQGGGVIPAGGAAFVVDQALRITTGTGGSLIRYNEATKRVYRWEPGTANFTTVTTQSQLLAAQGVATPDRADGGGFQGSKPAFSGDGQSLYYDASGSATAHQYGGIWRVDLATGAPTRIFADNARSSAEMGVKYLAGGVDRLYVRGSANTGASSVNGLATASFDRNTNTLGSFSTLISGTELREFVRGPVSNTYNVSAVVVDQTTGNIYFEVNGGTSAGRRQVILRYDTLGRLAKVASYADRENVFGDGNLGFTTNSYQIIDGVEAGLNIRRLLWGEQSTSTGYIGAVNLFEPGDFNRDGLVNAVDGATLAQSGAIKTVGVSQGVTGNFKFDLNGDTANTQATGISLAVVDYHDVKVFQKFFNFANGDANIDGALNLADLSTLGANYGLAGKVWTEGDFTGDDAANLTDLQTLATAWTTTLGQPAPTLTQVNANYAGQFRSDVIATFPVDVEFEWANAAGGSWNNDGNWTGGAPNQAGAKAVFGNVGAAPVAVNVEFGVLVDSIIFNSPASYTVSGGAINLDADGPAGVIRAVAGSHVISAPVLLYENLTLDSEAGASVALTTIVGYGGKTIGKTGAGSAEIPALGTLGSVVVSGGTLDITAGGAALHTVALSVAAGAVLSLNDNDLIVDYAGASPIAAIIAAVVDGRISVDGDFGGLPTYLAVAEAADLGLVVFGGYGVDETAVVAKFTYVGDANLDGQVDALDYERVDLAIGNSGVKGVAQGDLNYDGNVDALDYEQIDLNIGNGVGAPLAAMEGGRFIPEPAGLGLVALVGAVMGRRRR
jgi:hypothetical protein